jgi:hypothetical protein
MKSTLKHSWWKVGALIGLSFLLSACGSIAPYRVAEEGERVRDNQVLLLGRIDFDVQFEQDLGAGSYSEEGEVEVFLEVGDKIKFAVVPFNEYFAIRVDRASVELSALTIYTLYRYSVSGNTRVEYSEYVNFEYELPPIDIAPDDQFVYIGDFQHRFTHRNPYGIQDSRVFVVDNYETALERFRGYATAVDGTPLSPENKATVTTQARLSDGFNTYYQDQGRGGPPDNLHSEEQTALTLKAADAPSSGQSIAVIAADTTNQSLRMAEMTAELLSDRTSLNVVSESAIAGSLPLYPANLVAEGNLFGNDDTALLATIGESIGADFVYAVRRGSASMTTRDRAIGYSERFEIAMEGVLIDVDRSSQVGQTRYYAKNGKWVAGGVLAGWGGASDAYEQTQSNALGEIADAVVSRFEEVAPK